MKNSIKDVSAIIRKMPMSKFTNEHGESFTIYSNGNTVFMEGSETEAMVDESKKMDGILPLFNPSFNIWSVEELYKLGQSLVDVAVQNGYATEGDETYEYRDHEIFARVHISTDDMFAIEEDGKLKNAQGFSSGQDKNVVWYEVVGEVGDTEDTGDTLRTLDEAKAYIDNLLDNE